MASYKDDPRWMNAKFDSKDKNGNAVKKGDRIFYYPRTRTVLTGDAAEQASREFEAAKADEEFISGY